MSIARKILSNTVAQIFGKLAVAVLGLTVVKISTNYLSLEGYGEYVLIYEFLAFFGITADLGLFTIAVREMARDEKNITKIIGNILSLRTILVVSTMILATVAAFMIPNYEGTRIPLGVAIASVTTLLTILNGTLTSVLQTKLQMHLASLTVVLGKAVSVGAMFYVVFWGWPNDNVTGFYMLVVAGILGMLTTLLGTTYYVRKITPIRYQFDLALWKDVLWKSLPYGIALILNTIYFRIDSILISFMRGQEEVGIYGVAMKMLENIAVVPLYFMNSVLPVLTRALKEKTDHYKKIISYAFDFLAALSLPIVVGGSILAYPIIFIVSTPEFLSDLGHGFYGSDIALRILIFASLFQFINILFAFILIAVNKQYKLLYINAVCVVFNIVTNLIFIPHYGFRGAAFTSVLSELLILVATYFTARHALKFSISLKNLTKITLSALVMGAIIYALQPPTYSLMQNWNVLVLVPLGGLIYLVMLFITKTISREMLATILRKDSGDATSISEQTP